MMRDEFIILPLQVCSIRLKTDRNQPSPTDSPPRLTIFYRPGKKKISLPLNLPSYDSIKASHFTSHSFHGSLTITAPKQKNDSTDKTVGS